MKRCPTCQKEFADSMRFCQTDGTPLVEAAQSAEPPDPFKTIIAGAPQKEDAPDKYDPMKTVVSSSDAPKIDAPPPSPFGESESQALTPSQSNDPSLNPPSFGDLSPSSSSDTASSSSSQSSSQSSTPFSNESNRSDSPFGKPSSNLGASPFDKPSNEPSSTPFDKTPPPPYKEPEPMFGTNQPPFDQSPFGQPQTPFGQSQEPANQTFQQNEWTPPPAPVAAWQEQGLGANTPFQPPTTTGEDKTLAIVSLVSGILSVTCCGAITGIVALITGYMAKNNADSNPEQYGGRGLAVAGMILGGISIVLTVLYLIFVVFSGAFR